VEFEQAAAIKRVTRYLLPEPLVNADDNKATNYRATAADIRDMAKQISLKQDQSGLLQSAAEWDRLAQCADKVGRDTHVSTESLRNK